MICLDLCNALGGWGNFACLCILRVKLDEVLKPLIVVCKRDGLHLILLLLNVQFITSLAVSSVVVRATHS